MRLYDKIETLCPDEGFLDLTTSLDIQSSSTVELVANKPRLSVMFFKIKQQLLLLKCNALEIKLTFLKEKGL